MSRPNTLAIGGNLTRDAEMKYTASGTAWARFSIAHNIRVKKDNEWTDQVSFFDCQVWGKTAESLNQYLKKGQGLTIEGEIRQDRWTDKDGQARSKVFIHANKIHLDPKAKASGYQQDAQQQDDFQDDLPI